MLFGIFYITGAILLLIIPVFSAWYFSKRWNLPKKIFLKAGATALIVDLFYLAVMGNGGTMLPSWVTGSPLLMALIIGIVSGLFSELGRYLVLDKVFPKLRSFREGLYFAMGWSGVTTFLIGIIMLITVPAIQILISSDNVEAMLPDASTQEIIQLREARETAIELVNGNPFMALTTVAERGSKMALDLSLTVLVLLSLATGETKYTWSAVGLRSLILFVFSYAGAFSHLAADFIMVALAAFSLSIIRQYRKKYPKYLR